MTKKIKLNEVSRRGFLGRSLTDQEKDIVQQKMVQDP